MKRRIATSQVKFRHKSEFSTPVRPRSEQKMIPQPMTQSCAQFSEEQDKQLGAVLDWLIPRQQSAKVGRKSEKELQICRLAREKAKRLFDQALETPQ